MTGPVGIVDGEARPQPTLAAAYVEIFESTVRLFVKHRLFDERDGVSEARMVLRVAKYTARLFADERGELHRVAPSETEGF